MYTKYFLPTCYELMRTERVRKREHGISLKIPCTEQCGFQSCRTDNQSALKSGIGFPLNLVQDMIDQDCTVDTFIQASSNNAYYLLLSRLIGIGWGEQGFDIGFAGMIGIANALHDQPVDDDGR